MQGSIPERANSNTSFVIATLVCAIALGVGVVTQPSAAWAGTLTAGFFGLTIGLGACMFTAINAVTGARWSTPLYAVFVTVGRTLLVPAVLLAVTFVFGLSVLYPWAQHGVVEHNHLVQLKTAWLNTPFFLARAGIILLLFLALAGTLFRDGRDSGRRRPSAGTGAVFIVFFALGISVASWDWIMSLEPEWFSTMFGVYGFAGSFVGGIAAVAFVSLMLRRFGNRKLRMADRQVHDLGSMLFGFSMFWAYIWFCQYMLIWYANLPEETPYYATRLSGGWAAVFWLNPVINFVIPFVALLSSRAKRHPSTLLQVAGIVLVGRWLDVYLMVGPATRTEPGFPIYVLAATVIVIIGMFTLGRRTLARQPTQS